MGAYAIQVSLESRNVCALSVLKDSEGQSDYLPNNVIRLRQCRTHTIQDNLDNRGADLFKKLCLQLKAMRRQKKTRRHILSFDSNPAQLAYLMVLIFVGVLCHETTT